MPVSRLLLLRLRPVVEFCRRSPSVDRTHRIGQTRPVTVYRLVSQGTVEERVVALQARKRELFTAVVDEGEALGSAITASDIRALVG